MPARARPRIPHKARKTGDFLKDKEHDPPDAKRPPCTESRRRPHPFHRGNRKRLCVIGRSWSLSPLQAKKLDDAAAGRAFPLDFKSTGLLECDLRPFNPDGRFPRLQSRSNVRAIRRSSFGGSPEAASLT